MSTPLLKRTLRVYLIFSIVVILVTMPVFYLIIQKMFLNDTDEALLQDKKELVRLLQKHPDETMQTGIEDWERNVVIKKATNFNNENKFFTSSDVDTLSKESEPFRNLSTFIHVNNQNYNVVLRLSLADSEDLAQGILITQLILLILLLSGLWWLTRRQSNILWKPFYGILQSLQQFELEKQTAINLPDTDIYEFQQLNEAIKILVEKNYKTYLQQKEFTENASHEMQTPLAVLQSQIDLLLQSPDLTSDQANIIHSISIAIMRLASLNKGLSLLTKIENNQFVEKTAVNIAELMERNLVLLDDQLAAQNIKLTRQLDETITVNANPLLMEVLLSNLLLNAIRHNYNGGEINIVQDRHKLVIKNTGVKEPLDEKIFNRFYKQNIHPQGTGLGLAIIKQICKIYRFDINYSYWEDRQLHVFTVNFFAG